MRPTLAIGTSDFRKIRDQGSLYVDKTLLLQRFLEDGDETLLLPRPRRATKGQCERALSNLSRHLHEHHQQPVVILIDEHDAPIHEALSRGY